jgi:hypothetical protein
MILHNSFYFLKLCTLINKKLISFALLNSDNVERLKNMEYLLPLLRLK